MIILRLLFIGLSLLVICGENDASLLAHLLIVAFVRGSLLLIHCIHKVSILLHYALLLILGSNNWINIPPVAHISKGGVMGIVNNGIVRIDSARVLLGVLMDTLLG